MGDTEDLANLAKLPQFSPWKLWDRREGTVIAHQRALHRKGMGQYGEHVAHTLMSAATMAEMLQRSSQNQRSSAGERRSKTAHELGRCCLPPLRHQLIEIPLITPLPWPKAVWHQGVADQPSELACNRRTNIRRW